MTAATIMLDCSNLDNDEMIDQACVLIEASRAKLDQFDIESLSPLNRHLANELRMLLRLCRASLRDN